jgi:putative ABC transport system substrate-binding protein
VIDRRTFIEVIAGGLLAAPMVAQAQLQAKVFRIGILSSASVTSPEAVHIWDAFFQGLRELGYVDGRNIVIEGRYYGDNVERLHAP